MALTPYSGDEHKPFLWTAGQPAALLVHGFAGTPAEMRPLAQALHTAGWTVQGILLPGFGAQIASLGQRQAQEWTAATQSALVELTQRHSPVLLVGFSMGGAAAIAATVASPTPPHALVLLAPFTQLGADWQQPLWPLARRIFREFRPFAKADFRDPEVRHSIAFSMPDADLDDPQVQAELRAISLPAAGLDQLGRMGRLARREARRLSLPTLIVQGQSDLAVNPRHTRRLAASMDPQHTRLVEIDGTHQIVQPWDVGWPAARSAVLDFAAQWVQL